MNKGRVKWFNTEKGFGFIVGEDGRDIFVHVTDLDCKELRDGDLVIYELGQTKKGMKAVKVSLDN